MSRIKASLRGLIDRRLSWVVAVVILIVLHPLVLLLREVAQPDFITNGAQEMILAVKKAQPAQALSPEQLRLVDFVFSLWLFYIWVLVSYSLPIIIALMSGGGNEIREGVSGRTNTGEVFTAEIGTGRFTAATPENAFRGFVGFFLLMQLWVLAYLFGKETNYGILAFYFQDFTSYPNVNITLKVIGTIGAIFGGAAIAARRLDAQMNWASRTLIVKLFWAPPLAVLLSLLPGCLFWMFQK